MPLKIEKAPAATVGSNASSQSLPNTSGNVQRNERLSPRLGRPVHVSEVLKRLLAIYGLGNEVERG